jgi:hypothetical protein
VPALRDDHVGVALGWLDELHVHGPHRRQVLVDYGFNGSSPFADVPAEAPNEAQIRVRVDEDFDVHEFAQRLVFEDENAFQNYRSGRIQADSRRGSLVLRKIVHGAIDGLSLSK